MSKRSRGLRKFVYWWRVLLTQISVSKSRNLTEMYSKIWFFFFLTFLFCINRCFFIWFFFSMFWPLSQVLETTRNPRWQIKMAVATPRDILLSVLYGSDVFWQYLLVYFKDYINCPASCASKNCPTENTMTKKRSLPSLKPETNINLHCFFFLLR